MAKAIAHVSGVALKPGISRNNRLYTRQAIAHMVAQAQERIESGEGLAMVDRTKGPAPEPITQRSHHAADDDSLRIVGRVTHLSLDENGAARFKAAIADTPHGRTIASLLDTSDGQAPFLRNVSIRAGWVGDVRTILGKDNEVISAADALELDGLDYTASPGVPGAQVDSFEWASGAPGAPGETAGGRVLITESILEAYVDTITEETPAAEVAPAAPPVTEAAPAAAVSEALAGDLRGTLRSALPLEQAHTLRNGLCVTCTPVGEGGDAPGNGKLPYGDTAYADPGYQSDKQKRYPIDTKAHVKAALAYLAQKGNAAKYSAPQLKRVMGRIRAAAKKFGITVSAEGWSLTPATQVTEAVVEFMGEPHLAGSWSVNACNGPVSINLSSYCMDPADLDVVLRAAVDGACKALSALDPDMDGDVDVAGVGDRSDTDHDHGKESAPAAAVSEGLTASLKADMAALNAAMTVEAARFTAAVTGLTETIPETAAEPGGEPDEAPPVEETVHDPAPEPAAATETEEEAVMADTTSETAAGTASAVTTATALNPPGVVLTGEQFAALLEAFRPQAPVAEAAPAAPAPAAQAPAAAAPAPVAEAPAAPQIDEATISRMVEERLNTILAAHTQGQQAPPVTETEEQRLARLVEAQVTERMQAMVANGDVTPTRAGLTPQGEVSENRVLTGIPGTAAEGLNGNGLPASWPDKPLHQYSSEELAQYTGPVLDHHVMGGRAVTTLR
jgi:hypothetical protein